VPARLAIEDFKAVGRSGSGMVGVLTVSSTVDPGEAAQTDTGTASVPHAAHGPYAMAVPAPVRSPEGWVDGGRDGQAGVVRAGERDDQDHERSRGSDGTVPSVCPLRARHEGKAAGNNGERRPL